jgi:hypothetical protein
MLSATYYIEKQGPQVRKTPRWPRGWANCSLSSLCAHQNAWVNLHGDINLMVTLEKQLLNMIGNLV